MYDVLVVSDETYQGGYLLERYTLDHEPKDWEIIERACRDRGYDDTDDAMRHGITDFKVLVEEI